MIPQKVVGWVLAILTPFLVIGLMTSWLRHNDLAKRFEALEKENETLDEENQSLEELLSFVSLDAVKEFEVRKKLNFVKPGEKLVIFVSPSPSPQATTTENFWQKIKNWFKK